MSNHALIHKAGSERWVETMYNELSKQHDVEVYTPQNNTLFPYMKRYSGGYYDLGILNHNNCLKGLKLANIKTRVFTSHGTRPILEQPVKGADFYVSVSEEVQANLKSKGFESNIIRNPIDTYKFRPTKHVNPKLTNILYMSNKQGHALGVVTNACKDYNLRVVGGKNSVDDVVEAINWADLVISLGRGVYEAMSCGRNAIVYDFEGGDGYVSRSSIIKCREFNCSGRKYRIKYTADMLKETLLSYNPHKGNDLRDYIKHNNNITKVAQEYLKYADDKTNR